MLQIGLQDDVLQCDHGGAALGPRLNGALPAYPASGVRHAALREPVPFHHQHVRASARHYPFYWKHHTCHWTRIGNTTLVSGHV